ncbi:MAG TPA: orotidine-5'-phosphate decarboxylase [Caulobacterales bacterium]|nr:orotidine-5'-phosphate decarboxylase [Caulobacterales bacterium]
MSTAVFADRAIEAARRLNTPLCVGLDPMPEHIPALFGDARADIGAVETFLMEMIELAKTRAPMIKPQIAFFEQFGVDGYALAQRVCAAGKAAGLVVLLDAKRGDIGSTAQAYARACLGPAPGFDADCVTVNAYLGRDSIEPFIELAEASAKGVALLVRTSNPGAQDLQDLKVYGRPLWEAVAQMISPEAFRLEGESGYSGLMAVTGATYPMEAQRLRGMLPKSLFLVPGYGAQGGSARAAMAGFVQAKRGLEGGFVSASRSILYPAPAAQASSLPAWRAAIAAAIDGAVHDLRSVEVV